MSNERKKIIVLAAGGHARVLIDAIAAIGTYELLGIVDPAVRELPAAVGGIAILGDDSAVERYDPSEVSLVNGLGSVGDPDRRKRLFERFKQRGFRFETIIHPSAVIARDVVLGEGAQVMAGAVVQTESTIGENAIVNTRASVDHGSTIGRHAHVAPGAVLSGGVRIGESVHVGAGAVVIEGISVGDGSLIAAGAAVIRDVTPGTRVAGVPAKAMKS